jgi:hypothetical protein
MTTTNHKNAKRFNRDGREVPNVGPLADGDYIRTPMSMMDSAHVQHLEDKNLPIGDVSLVRHSRGYIGIDAPAITADTVELMSQAEASYAERKDKLSRAWMLPVAKPATPPLKKDEAPIVGAMPPVDDRVKATAADVDAAIERRNARLENSWKGAAA